MGRYGIGARVRDKEGDLAEVIGKPEKGYRDVRIIGGKYDGMTYWAPKSELTPIAVDTAEPASCCAEKGEVAFAVGDRVVASERKYEAGAFVGWVAAIDGCYDIAFDDGWTGGHCGDARDVSENHWWCDAEQLRHFTLEAGKFYRTRDGRKVGPMEYRGGYFSDPAASGTPGHYAVNGISAFVGELPASKGRERYDIVAEWVGPAATADQAAPWADFDHWDAPPAKIVVEDVTDPVFSFIVGDLAKTRNGVTVKIIEIDQSNAYPIAHDRGEGGYHACSPNGKSCIGEDEWDIVTAVTTAEPKPKFKVGDRVVFRKYMNGEDCFGTAIEVRDGVVFANDWSVGSADGALSEDRLELVTAPPLMIGHAVTAQGYISGANGSNFSVVFGDRSYDLPATMLKKAA